MRRPYSMRFLNKQPVGARVTGVVKLTLNEVLDAGFEGFLDLISTRLIGSELLSDSSYKAVGTTRSGDLLIEVSGDPTLAVEGVFRISIR